MADRMACAERTTANRTFGRGSAVRAGEGGLGGVGYTLAPVRRPGRTGSMCGARPGGEMTEILTESFCERCGTRYTFEAAAPREGRLFGLKTLSKGLRNFVLSDDTSFGEAMADARSDVDRRASSEQLDAFHRTFNFCMSCRQYTCGSCWNTVEGRCLTCAPNLGRDVLGAPFRAVTQSDVDAAVQPHANGHSVALDDALAGSSLAWPAVDLPPTGAVDGDTDGAGTSAEAAVDTTPIDRLEALLAGSSPAPTAEAAPPAAESEATAPADGAVVAEAESTTSFTEPETLTAAEGTTEGQPDGLPPTAPTADVTATRNGDPAATAKARTADLLARFRPRPSAPARRAPLEPEPAVPPPPAPPAPAPISPSPAPATAPPVATAVPIPTPTSPAAAPIAIPAPRPAAASIRPAARTAPQWPTQAPAWPPLPTADAADGPHWPTPQPARPARGADAVWAQSSRDVLRPEVGVQACVSCGLPLSATARFCRRCGSNQLTA